MKLLSTLLIASVSLLGAVSAEQYRAVLHFTSGIYLDKARLIVQMPGHKYQVYNVTFWDIRGSPNMELGRKKSYGTLEVNDLKLLDGASASADGEDDKKTLKITFKDQELDATFTGKSVAGNSAMEWMSYGFLDKINTPKAAKPTNTVNSTRNSDEVVFPKRG
ncbi:hypothetical protein EC973_002027 [Apophysomyces ossiformis]|uniref:Uncharacterized protein n=1 Tax=Apophysomyces ossiformis TaxID=679940 RepID=A0A8H7BSY6_9FUNG|nr:hypothetical protein EC973_002027 [Apophysomyces ossiformis]